MVADDAIRLSVPEMLWIWQDLGVIVSRIPMLKHQQSLDIQSRQQFQDDIPQKGRPTPAMRTQRYIAQTSLVVQRSVASQISPQTY